MDHVVRAPSVSFASLLPRQTCVTSCPTEPCPTCPTGTVCQLSLVEDCFTCPKNYCAVDTQTTAPAPASAGGPSVGAMAGGVTGGVAAIGIITYLVWRFCIKAKRQPIDQEPWDEEKEQSAIDAEKDFATRRDQRSSMHTVHSVASTVLTRASNIIQIAYIPGVTNRATPTSPTLLVPPVPPIPIAVSQASSPTATDDQHFFMPSDLRDSTYSAMSGYTDRTSYARTSYAPRSSIASTIYGKSAVVVAPAQTGMRAKPAMVSVPKSTISGSALSSGSRTPPVPSVDYEKYSGVRPPSPANSTFSIGSTFLNNASAHTAMAARPQVVRVGSGPKKPSHLGTSVQSASPATYSALEPSSSVSSTPQASPLPLTPTPSPLAQMPTFRDSAAVTVIEEEGNTPRPDTGSPFADPPKSPSHKSTTSLSAVIEEATRRASQRDTKSTERERSPFGDEHATRE